MKRNDMREEAIDGDGAVDGDRMIGDGKGISTRVSRFKKVVMLSKLGGVALFAFGTERLTHRNFILGITFMILGIVISLMPLRIKIREPDGDQINHG